MHTFIFMGRSGSGKGTQIKLLKDHIVKKTNTDIAALDMGGVFRAFFEETGYVQDIAKDITMVQGKFQPDFLTNALCVRCLVTIYDPNKHLFLDGFPRSESQLATLKDFFAYVEIKNPIIVYLDTSRQSVTDRLLARGRGDDTDSAIISRQDEFDRAVLPMIETIKKDPSIVFMTVDGEGTIEEIHARVVEKINL